jgi:hypothetical protein
MIQNIFPVNPAFSSAAEVTQYDGTEPSQQDLPVFEKIHNQYN